MEAVLQNSSISLTNLSQSSNPSTARLLIDHIKRLVEDDMKLTVEAFKIIENEIVFDDHRSESIGKKNKRAVRNTSNRSSVKSQHSTSPSTRQSEFPIRNGLVSKSGGSIHMVNISNSELSHYNRFENNGEQKKKINSNEKQRSSSRTSTPIRNRSIGSGKQFQNFRLSSSQGCESFSHKNYTDGENVPITSSTPRGSISNLSSIQPTISRESNLSNKNSALQGEGRRNPTNSNNTSKLSGLTTDDNIDEDFISLTRVASMFHSRFTEEIKKVMDRIHQRFNNESHSKIENVKKPALQTITRRAYDDFSRIWTVGSTTPSADTRQKSTNRDRKKLRLPQLLAFSSNSKLNIQGSDLTIDSENIVAFDRRYKRNVETSETDDKSHLGADATEKTDDSGKKEIDLSFEENDEKSEVADIVTKVAIAAVKISEAEIDVPNDTTEKTNENVEESGKTEAWDDRTPNTAEQAELKSIGKGDDSTQKSIGSVGSTADVHKVPEPTANSPNDIVTITDIGSENTFTKSPLATPKTTDNELARDEELTDTFSSSLVATPQTTDRETSREWSDLDEIASLINQASPSRRIVIKKKLPDVDVKGYNKVCNEKLIFSGNKITHVKIDRKTMCRDFNPK